MKVSHVVNKFANIVYTYLKYPGYLKFQSKSASDIKLYQERKLKHIVTIAVNKVPYYKPYKSEIDFDNFSLQELKKLPILDKDTIRKNPLDFIREDKNINNLQWKSTSGSSGKPFKVPKCYFSDGIEVMLGYRAWSFGKHSYGLREPAIVIRSFSPKENEPIHKRDIIRNFWYLSPYHINDAHLPVFLDTFKKSKAKVLKGYPSSVYILTLLLKKHNIKLPQIQTIITSSETMLPKYRDEIESYWQCDVLDWYGQNERTVTVQQCSYGNYHNNDDYGICEIDTDNTIIATSLNNDIMPLLRYHTNDKAIPLLNKNITCECGRAMHIPFKGIEGRQDDILYKEGKEAIPTINFYNLMEKFQNIKQFYILQEEDLSVNMEISENQPLNDKELFELREGIIQRLGNVPLQINVVKEIQRNKQTDKVKIIESKVKP
ncbi:MAG: phenylacetate--CoA ligase family protein [Gelidibacter sp.]|nr:phenylacetate--CoA ligase family protein [Gelidibacter sp.]